MNLKKKKTKSKDFTDCTLAYGLVKRMNGFAFCSTGDKELVRLGFMMKSNPKVMPYITVKGKRFIMEIMKEMADEIPEDKPIGKPIEQPKQPAPRPYHEPQLDDEDEDDEEDEYDEEVKKSEEDKEDKVEKHAD